MNEETKGAIHIILDMLRTTVVESGVSMGTSKGKIMFFDTNTYAQTGKLDGFSVDLEGLVK